MTRCHRPVYSLQMGDWKVDGGGAKHHTRHWRRTADPASPFSLFKGEASVGCPHTSWRPSAPLHRLGDAHSLQLCWLSPPRPVQAPVPDVNRSSCTTSVCSLSPFFFCFAIVAAQSRASTQRRQSGEQNPHTIQGKRAGTPAGAASMCRRVCATRVRVCAGWRAAGHGKCTTRNEKEKRFQARSTAIAVPGKEAAL